jgi:hypothetical protein
MEQPISIPDIDFKEIEIINTSLQTNLAERYQSVDLLIEHGAQVSQWIVYTGAQMAIAAKHLNHAKKSAYLKLEFSLKAQGQKNLSPMLMKDYVNASCEQAQYVFDFTERTHRSAVHYLDFLRSALSALKEEAKATSFYSGYKN